MSISRTVVQELRLHPGRFVATIAAIVLSVGLLVATQVFMATEHQGVATQFMRYATHADGVIDNVSDIDRPESAGAAVVAELRRHPDVAAVEVVPYSFTEIVARAGETSIMGELLVLPDNPVFHWVAPLQGRLPQAAGEVMLAQGAAKKLGVGVGDKVAVSVAVDQKATIVGLTDEPGTSSWPAYAHKLQQLNRQMRTHHVIFQIKLGAQVATIASQVRSEVSKRGLDAAYLKIETKEAASERYLESFTKGRDVMGAALGAFGVIALVTGMIIIANTFAIIVAQRRRHIGLLRTVGASHAQVIGRFLAETLLLGVIGATLGCAFGVGLGAAASMWTGNLRYGFAVPWLTLMWAWLGGTVATVAAAMLPILRGARLLPLEALQAQVDAVPRRRFAIVRALLALLLMAAGAVAVYSGVTSPTGKSLRPLMITSVGVSLLGIGLLVATVLYLPALLGIVGRLLAKSGPLARLAAANSQRNPRRTAATAVALILGVGLCVSLQVAASSMGTSGEFMVEKRYPVDAVFAARSQGVQASDVGSSSRYEGTLTPLPTTLASQAAATPNVAAVALVPMTEQVTITTGDPDKASIRAPLAALNSDVRAFLPAAAELQPGEIGLNGDHFRQLDVQEGALINIYPFDQQEASAPLVQLKTRLFNASGVGVFVIPDTITTLKKSTTPSALMVKYTDIATCSRTSRFLSTEMSTPLMPVDGGAGYKGAISALLTQMMWVMTLLLAVTIMIALIGVSNTLGLSVLERTKESALLRTLGLQASGLRWMLLIEALLLSAVSMIVGIGVGLGFGWLGAKAATLSLDMPKLVFSIDWAMTSVLILVVLVAAGLASVVPGRRASTAMPVEALADHG